MHRPTLVFALFSTLLCTPAQAGVHWLCGLSDDLTRLVCIADTDPFEPASAAATAAPTAVVRGTRFPLDPRRVQTVDMWSPATDLAFVELLARSTICYRSPGCEVSVSAMALSPATLSAAARTN